MSYHAKALKAPHTHSLCLDVLCFPFWEWWGEDGKLRCIVKGNIATALADWEGVSGDLLAAHQVAGGQWPSPSRAAGEHLLPWLSWYSVLVLALELWYLRKDALEYRQLAWPSCVHHGGLFAVHKLLDTVAGCLQSSWSRAGLCLLASLACSRERSHAVPKLGLCSLVGPSSSFLAPSSAPSPLSSGHQHSGVARGVLQYILLKLWDPVCHGDKSTAAGILPLLKNNLKLPLSSIFIPFPVKLLLISSLFLLAGSLSQCDKFYLEHNQVPFNPDQTCKALSKKKKFRFEIKPPQNSEQQC